MIQESHKLYKELYRVKGIYYKYKNSGPGGISKNFYQEMLMKMKYDYIKKKLEYLKVSKYDMWESKILFQTMGSNIPFRELKKRVNEKLIIDTEIINLYRLIKITKMKLLLSGYNKTTL